ncbi:Proton-translocating NADH-quinone oxidoreductase subunit L [Kibdelosporangium sp. 4NS15]|uniref:Proton-translocating NADH-quinone oxidoreductase subunit L n=1 Tax=Kibdelosporangium persicum TaxID=2698649 RepID=A0ABX2FEB4_9PSEU|nr:Proton-translocating NADH-quinone oxidoreductase subunit L [Kibdelosporangium persicum]
MIGIATAVLAVTLAVLAAVGRPAVSAPLIEGLPVGLAVDGLSAVMVVTISTVLLAVLVYAAGEFGRDEAHSRFYGLMLLFAGAMLITVTATNLVTLLMAWEVMGAMSYALIAFWWRETDRATSGMIAFLTTRGGDVGLYLAAGAALAGGALGLDLAGLAGVPGVWRDAVVAGVVLAALGKSAQLPFSFWLSRAMAGPSPVSALLHSATMVAAGAYLLLRLQPLLAATPWAGPLVAWVGVLTALALAAVAVAQSDLKQVLAASTCSQIGFMVLAAGTGAVTAGAGQLVAHAATKSLLFLGAGAWLTVLGTKQLGELRGAARRYPLLGITFTIGALSLAGVPPLSIWLTKDAVLSAALHTSPALYVMGLAAVVLSGAYVGRALGFVWARTPDRAENRASVLSQVPLPFLAAASALLGVVIAPQLSLSWWELGLSGLLAVTGVLVALRMRAGTRGLLGNWLGIESMTRSVIVGPTLSLATALARFDDKVVDGGVRAAAATGAAVARLTNARLEISLDAVVGWVARGSRALGRWARRPQTGQLHQYYAQAVVGLVVLAVLLMIVR